MRKFNAYIFMVTLFKLVCSTNKEGATASINSIFSSLDALVIKPSKQAFSKLRKTVSFIFFKDKFNELISIFEENHRAKYRGLSLTAVDGDQYHLPRTKNILSAGYRGLPVSETRETHMLIMNSCSAIDVLSGTPIDFEYSSSFDEVETTIRIIQRQNKANTLFLLDRLYFQTRILKVIGDDQFYIIRCKKGGTFKPIIDFIASEKTENIVIICGKQVRLIKIKTKNGLMYLATNLDSSFSINEIYALYLRRWDIETSNREATDTLKIEQFHSKTINGILQEIYAALLLRAITKIEIAANSPIPQVMNNTYKKANFKEVFTFVKENLFTLIFSLSQKIYLGLKMIILRSFEKRTRNKRSFERKVVSSNYRRYKKDTTRPRSPMAKGGGTLS